MTDDRLVESSNLTEVFLLSFFQAVIPHLLIDLVAKTLAASYLIVLLSY